MEEDRLIVRRAHRCAVPPSLAKGAQPRSGERTLGTLDPTQTQQEDDLVVRLVAEHGPRNWSYIAKQLPGRIGKQCRERWHNHLNPHISKDKWTEHEDSTIIHAHHQFLSPHTGTATSGPSSLASFQDAPTTPSKTIGIRLSKGAFVLSTLLSPTPLSSHDSCSPPHLGAPPGKNSWS